MNPFSRRIPFWMLPIALKKKRTREALCQQGSKNHWLLHQCRTAVFYLAECWAALGNMERLIDRDTQVWPDAMGTFFQLQSLFSQRDLHAPDLAFFLAGLRELDRSAIGIEQSLKKKTRVEILNQLRKANWTYDQVLRLSKIVSRSIKLDPEIVLEQFGELGIQATDGPLTMDQVDEFLLATPKSP